MRDEMDGRMWAEHHDAFSADVATFLARIAKDTGAAFRRLNAIEFDAPWRRDSRGPGHA